MTFKNK